MKSTLNRVYEAGITVLAFLLFCLFYPVIKWLGDELDGY